MCRRHSPLYGQPLRLSALSRIPSGVRMTTEKVDGEGQKLLEVGCHMQGRRDPTVPLDEC